MRRFYITKENINENTVTVSGDDFSHLKNVLRLNIGDSIVCFSGDGLEYVCQIELFSPGNEKNGFCTCSILEKRKITSKNFTFTLFQAMPKGDKIELIIQKMTELGLDKIVPFESKFTIAKPQKDKTGRFNKIALEACKQCGRADILTVENPISFSQLLTMLPSSYDLILFAYEKQGQSSLKEILSDAKKSAKNKPLSIAMIIGSEGGFSEEEADKLKTLSKPVSLGKIILRCETAPIVLATLVNYEMEGGI